MSNLDIALAQAALGRRVFPLAADTKKPLVKWTEEASAKEINIRRWWKRFPDAGVAWRLPEGVAVVDVDHPDELTLDLPDAPGQTTTRGYHRLYSTDADTVAAEPGLSVTGFTGSPFIVCRAGKQPRPHTNRGHDHGTESRRTVRHDEARQVRL